MTQIKTRHFWLAGLLIAAGATWVTGQAPIGGIINPFDAGAAGVYKFGPSAGISLNGSNFAFGNGTAGNLTGSILAANIGDDVNFNGRVGFGCNNASDVCMTATDGTQRFLLNSSRLAVHGSLPLCFTPGTATSNACDTGYSRTGAAAVAIGNGTAGDASGTLKATNLQVAAHTVATLPTCNSGTEGTHNAVSDASAALTAGIGTIVANGGANHVPVFCDGTNWRIG